MELRELSSNGMVQKKHVSDPRPHLFKVKPNGSPPFMTLHLNTFAQNGKWECQPCCNICHRLAFDLHTFHTLRALSDKPDNDAIP